MWCVSGVCAVGAVGDITAWRRWEGGWQQQKAQRRGSINRPTPLLLCPACAHPVCCDVCVKGQHRRHARHAPHQQQQQAVGGVHLAALGASLVQPPAQVDCVGSCQGKNKNSTSRCRVACERGMRRDTWGKGGGWGVVCGWLQDAHAAITSTSTTPPTTTSCVAFLVAASWSLTKRRRQLGEQHQQQVHVHRPDLQRRRQRQQRGCVVRGHLWG